MSDNQYPAYYFSTDESGKLLRRLVHSHGEEQEAVKEGWVNSRSKLKGLKPSSVPDAGNRSISNASDADINALIEKNVLMGEELESTKKALAEANAKVETLTAELKEAINLLEEVGAAEADSPKADSKKKK